MMLTMDNALDLWRRTFATTNDPSAEPPDLGLAEVPFGIPMDGWDSPSIRLGLKYGHVRIMAIHVDVPYLRGDEGVVRRHVDDTLDAALRYCYQAVQKMLDVGLVVSIMRAPRIIPQPMTGLALPFVLTFMLRMAADHVLTSNADLRDRGIPFMMEGEGSLSLDAVEYYLDMEVVA